MSYKLVLLWKKTWCLVIQGHYLKAAKSNKKLINSSGNSSQIYSTLSVCYNSVVWTLFLVKPTDVVLILRDRIHMLGNAAYVEHLYWEFWCRKTRTSYKIIALFWKSHVCQHTQLVDEAKKKKKRREEKSSSAVLLQLNPIPISKTETSVSPPEGGVSSLLVWRALI